MTSATGPVDLQTVRDGNPFDDFTVPTTVPEQLAEGHRTQFGTTRNLLELHGTGEDDDPAFGFTCKRACAADPPDIANICPS